MIQNKSINFALLAFTTLALSSQSLGQVPPIGGNSSVTLGTQSGPYDITNLDKTKIETLYLGRLNQIADRDREYVKSIIEKARAEAQQFNSDFNDATKGGLLAMSREAQVNPSPVNPRLPGHADFLKAVSDFEIRMKNTRINIDTMDALIESIPNRIDTGLIRQDKDAAVGNIVVQLQSDLSKFKATIVASLDTLQKQAENLGHVVIVADPNGKDKTERTPVIIKANTGKGLTLEHQTVLVSSEDRETIREDIRTLRSWKTTDKEKLNAFTEFKANLLSQIKNTFGKTEKYRFRNDADLALRDDIFATFKKVMWMSSYFRTLNTANTGYIEIPFQKMIANIEIFLKSSDYVREIAYPKWMSAENQGWVRARQNAENILQVLAKRTGGVFKPKDGKFLSGANAFLTHLRGEMPVAEINNMIVQELAADLYEETLVAEGNMPTQEAFYRDRWRKTEADAALIDAWEDQLIKATDIELGTIVGHFRVLNDMTDEKQIRKDKAIEREAYLAMVTRVADSPSMKALDARRNRLRGK
jgi:hypothetical protein